MIWKKNWLCLSVLKHFEYLWYEPILFHSLIYYCREFRVFSFGNSWKWKISLRNSLKWYSSLLMKIQNIVREFVHKIVKPASSLSFVNSWKTWLERVMDDLHRLSFLRTVVLDGKRFFAVLIRKMAENRNASISVTAITVLVKEIGGAWSDLD